MAAVFSGAGSPRWSKRYPPLLGFALALGLAAFALPSALNVPQTNPSQTLEFAPVPPDDGDDNTPPGNASSLGLGSSSGVAGDGPGIDSGALPLPLPGGQGRTPRSKRCVGNPPRQTEDPLSPPCVAHFDGDNFGATAPGVTRSEVRILVYADGRIFTGTDAGADDETQIKGRMFDLAKPPSGDESLTLRNLRRYQRYFNDRFQTYGRFVHFYVFISAFKSNETTPETRRAEATANYTAVKPFAVITSGAVNGYDQHYVEVMARHGVISFGSYGGVRPASYYRRFPGLVWSYTPTVETKASLFSSYICQKVAKHPVDNDGDGKTGQRRVFGFLSTSDARFPAIIATGELVKKQIKACGVEIKAEGNIPKVGATYAARPTYAQQNMAQFSGAGVTTIIWPGGLETDQSRAAAALGYHPEWFVAGDGLHEGNNNGRSQEGSVWSHARVITTVTRQGGAQDMCRTSLAEADPNIGDGDTNTWCAFPYYVDMRQFFSGVQVAGPRLHKSSIDSGFHAIPAVRSSDPRVPACFYRVNDYTCVKDSTVQRWDPDGSSSADPTAEGCWRMVSNGARYLAGAWPAGNSTAQDSLPSVCNGYNAAAAAFNS